VLGVTLPDPQLKWNEARGHFDFGRSTGRNSGTSSAATPVQRDRLAERVRAWEDGAGLREAALAHAEKQRRRDRLAA